MTVDILDILCAHLTRDLFAIAQFLLLKRLERRSIDHIRLLSVCLYNDSFILHHFQVTSR